MKMTKRVLAMLLTVLLVLPCFTALSVFAAPSITVDGDIDESAWADDAWITVTQDNGCFQNTYTNASSYDFNYKFQLVQEDGKLYISAIFDTALANAPKVRFWIKSNSEATVYTHFYDFNEAAGAVGKYNTSLTANAGAAIENCSLVGALKEVDGKTQFEMSVDVAEFNGADGFEYFFNASANNTVEGVTDGITLLYPAVDMSGSDKLANYPYKTWSSDAAAKFPEPTLEWGDAVDLEDLTNVAAGKDVAISGSGIGYAQYTADLTDGVAYNSISYDNKWFAYYYTSTAAADVINAPAGTGTAIIDLGEVTEGIAQFRAHFGVSVGAGVKAPKSATVYGSVDGATYVKLGDFTLEADGVYWSDVTLENTVSARYIKFTFALGGTFAFVNELEINANVEIPVIGFDRVNHYDWTTKAYNDPNYEDTAISAGEIIVAASASEATVISKIQQNYWWWYAVKAAWNEEAGTFVVTAIDLPGEKGYEAWTVTYGEIVFACNTGYASTDAAGNKADADAIKTLAVGDKLYLYGDYAKLLTSSGAISGYSVSVNYPNGDGYDTSCKAPLAIDIVPAHNFIYAGGATQLSSWKMGATLEAIQDKTFAWYNFAVLGWDAEAGVYKVLSVHEGDGSTSDFGPLEIPEYGFIVGAHDTSAYHGSIIALEVGQKVYIYGENLLAVEKETALTDVLVTTIAVEGKTAFAPEIVAAPSYNDGLNIEFNEEEVKYHKTEDATVAGLSDGNWAEGATSFGDAGVYLIQNLVATDTTKNPAINFIWKYAEATQINTVKLGLYAEYMSMVGYPGKEVKIYTSDDGITWSEAIVADLGVEQIGNKQLGTAIATITLDEAVTAQYIKVSVNFEASPFADKVVWEFMGFTEVELSYVAPAVEAVTFNPNYNFKYVAAADAVLLTPWTMGATLESILDKEYEWFNFAVLEWDAEAGVYKVASVHVGTDIKASKDPENGVDFGTLAIPEYGFILGAHGQAACHDAVANLEVGTVLYIYGENVTATASETALTDVVVTDTAIEGKTAFAPEIVVAPSYDEGLNIEFNEDEVKYNKTEDATVAGLSDGKWGEYADTFGDADVYLIQNLVATDATKNPAVNFIWKYAEATEINTVKLGLYGEYNSMVGYPGKDVKIYTSDDGITWSEAILENLDLAIEEGNKGSVIATMSLDEAVTAQYIKISVIFPASPFAEKVVWEFMGFTEVELSYVAPVVIPSYDEGLNIEFNEEEVKYNKTEDATVAGLSDGKWAEGATSFGDADVYLIQNLVATDAAKNPVIDFIWKYAEATQINTVKLGLYGEYNSMVGYPGKDVKISVSEDGITWNEVTVADLGVEIASGDVGSVIATVTLDEAVTAQYIKISVNFPASPFADKVVWEFMGFTEVELSYVAPAVEILYGDIDGDGEIKANDYAMLKRYVLKTYTLEGDALLAADIDGNGTIEAKDYAMLKRHVLKTFDIGTVERG